MNKKTYLWIGLGLVVVIAVIYLLVAGGGNKTTNPTNKGVNPDNNASKINVLNPEGDDAAAPKEEKISKEVILEVDGASFKPKTIEIEAGSKGFLTFSALDDKKHLLASDDPKLPLLVTFSKEEGIKSTSFETPGVGTYTFYIDDKANTGTIVVK